MWPAAMHHQDCEGSMHGSCVPRCCAAGSLLVALWTCIARDCLRASGGAQIIPMMMIWYHDIEIDLISSRDRGLLQFQLACLAVFFYRWIPVYP
mmetsp:Transcript_34387/g.70301  ORF Transcript_34387/g.70301 Transcript_34387/m.70301 type:complete len:94 (+) Transcript_34387:148-429(+)